MGVSEAGGDDQALSWIVFHPDDGFVVVEEAEAGGDDVDKVRLHRHDRAEAPENPEDDLLQLEHAGSMTLAQGPVESGGRYPPFFGGKLLKSGRKVFGRPTNWMRLYPTNSASLPFVIPAERSESREPLEEFCAGGMGPG